MNQQLNHSIWSASRFVMWWTAFCTIIIIATTGAFTWIIAHEFDKKIDSIRPECKEAASATRYMGGKVEKPKVVYYPRGCWHK